MVATLIVIAIPILMGTIIGWVLLAMTGAHKEYKAEDYKRKPGELRRGDKLPDGSTYDGYYGDWGC